MSDGAIRRYPALPDRLRDVDEPNALIVRRRAADMLDEALAVLQELRYGYDEYYESGDLSRLLNSEAKVRDLFPRLAARG